MVKLYESGIYLLNGREIVKDGPDAAKRLLAATGKAPDKHEAARGTIAFSIFESHNTSGDMRSLKIKFDRLASHDITYVGIIQTARASGLDSFPMPYVLTNCHNSLCAVGGTINEDDHIFGLSAAKKYGGIYVPAHQAVIHQYMREMMSGCGKMILGSDSHTRYGALGTMAIGEGGPELVKQLLGKTYDLDYPEVIAVYLTGAPVPGVGPQDVALAIIKAVFSNGYVKNKVMEFVGDGIANLNMDFRNGIDVMTTETTCLSSIWETDEKTGEYFARHGRADDYEKLTPCDTAYYDGLIHVDLSKIRPMIALPFHPSNVYEIDELNKNPGDILREVEKNAEKQLGLPRFRLTDKIENGLLRVDQGVIAGCAGGTYDNLIDAADIIDGHNIGTGAFSLSIYPSSQPVYLCLVENGAIAKFILSGATVRTAFCGPCFGAGDVPQNNGLSIRHSTRNFPSREGSKPTDGQIASVALMDARSIAATAINGGVLRAATDLPVKYSKSGFTFNAEIYKNRVYDGAGKPDASVELHYGPNITDWPHMSALAEHLLLNAAAIIHDPVTTTDELIPSGETSSYRSNPQRLAEYTLSRKEPAYVGRAKAVRAFEEARLSGIVSPDIKTVFEKISALGYEPDAQNTGVGSFVYAVKPGDGSAREQAASCQRVLGGRANIAKEYATKRYRGNLINWGMLPFILDEEPDFELSDYIFIPDIKTAILRRTPEITAYVISGSVRKLVLKLPGLTEDEGKILLAGCLINYYAL